MDGTSSHIIVRLNFSRPAITSTPTNFILPGLLTTSAFSLALIVQLGPFLLISASYLAVTFSVCKAAV